MSSFDVEIDTDRDASEIEARLWDTFKIQGSSAARERLFAHHAEFARNIARRHHRERSYGDIELADLAQYAYSGLLEALDRFDPQIGTPFRPFAAHRISGSILDGIGHLNEMREQLSWRRRVRRDRLQSLSDDGTERTATPVEALAELAVGLALGFMLEGTGLVTENADEGAPQQQTAYDSLAWKETVGRLHAELAALPEREQTILRLHYMDGIEFAQIAALQELSKGRISQLHGAALLALRKRLREQRHFQVVR